nr:hypothetical protein [Tolivirales sp.]
MAKFIVLCHMQPEQPTANGLLVVLCIMFLIALLHILATIPHERSNHSFHTDNSKIQYITIGQNPQPVKYDPNGSPG